MGFITKINDSTKNHFFSFLVSITFPFSYTLGSIAARLIWNAPWFGGAIGGLLAGIVAVLIYKRIHLISGLVIPIVISILTVYSRPDLLLTYVFAVINYGLVIKHGRNWKKIW